MAIGFGVVKEDEEDYIIDILKRTPVVIALQYTTVGLQKRYLMWCRHYICTKEACHKETNRVGLQEKWRNMQ